MKFLSFLLVSLLLAAAKPYATMAPIDQYLIPNRADEIALARTAAAPSISDKADVLVLGKHGYETAVKGSNGFVCFVMRSWASTFDDPEFWNYKERSPNCFNAAAARSELPQIIARTQWAISGMSVEQIKAKTRSAFAAHTFQQPAQGAMTYMTSKRGYLGDAVGGPWYPHIMFFVPSTYAKAWGAGLKGSQIIGDAGDDTLGSTVLMIPTRRWSDGTVAAPWAPPMNH